METKQHIWRTRQDIEICQDCLYVSANGMPKHSDIVSVETKLHAEKYAKAIKTYGDEPYSIDEEPSFSHCSCDFCGETLGGHRFKASIMRLHIEN